MATIISPELKEKLRSRGVWDDFVLRREEIVATGVGSSQAGRMAISELAPDLTPSWRPRGRPKSSPSATPSPKPPAPPPSPSEPKPTLADVKRTAKDARFGFSAATVAPSDAVAEKTFAQKTCSRSAAFEWAFSHLVVKDVKAEDAPSMFAWSLFCLFRRSPAAVVDISKQCLTVSIRRDSEEEQTGGDFDGSAEYDLLKALAEGGEAAK